MTDLLVRLLRARGKTRRARGGAMLLFVAGILVGGFIGAMVIALAVAAGDDTARHGGTRTVSSGRNTGSSWAIAGNGDVTTGSRLGRFNVGHWTSRHVQAGIRE